VDIRTQDRLRANSLFAALERHELEVLAGIVVLRRFRKGSFILTQSHPGTCMYLLVSGRVKLSVASPDGKEIVLEHMEAPGHFGEMALVDEKVRSFDAIAMTDVEAFALDAKDLVAAVRVQPELVLSLIATQARRIRELVDRLEDLAFNDATARVMRVVLNIATARYETEGIPMVKGMTHYDIATLAATSRETASRVISALTKDGIIRSKGRTLVVDVIALRERMGSA